MKSLLRLSIGLFALSAAVLGVPQLTTSEKKGLEEALFIGNLTVEDLSFDRRLTSSEPLRGFTGKLQKNPLEGIDAVMRLHRAGTADLIRTLTAVDETLLDSGDLSPSQVSQEDLMVPNEIPEAYREVLLALATGISRSSARVRSALEKLTPDERRDLIESLPQLAVEPLTVKFDFVRRPILGLSEIEQLLSKVDRNLMALAARDLAEVAEIQVPKLQAISRVNPFSGQIKANFGKLVVVFAGVGANSHNDRDAVLTVDLGGNDTYTGRHGAGVGYSSLHLDLGGNDSYDVPDLSIGVGVLGVGISVDLGGDDQFRSKSLSFGAGIGGYGVFKKIGGQDHYDSGVLSLGAGLFGAGIAIDTAGNEFRKSIAFSQGFGGAGGLGWCLDLDGGDIYWLIGSSPETQLGPSVSAGQGAGFGVPLKGNRGGVGMLTDLKGNDQYMGTTRGQSYGENGHLGTLLDSLGDDTYQATEFSQAASCQSGLSYLIELSGDDVFLVTHGQAQAYSCLHGVSLLLNRTGNDHYVGSSVQPGSASSGGLSILVESEGTDRYSGSVALSTHAGSTDAIGLFIDLTGEDVYAKDHQNGEASVSPTYGIAVDQASSRRIEDTEPSLLADAPTPGSLPALSDSELAALYASAVQTIGKDRGKFKQSIHSLIGVGMPAFEWMLNDRLSHASAREFAIWALMLEALGPDARNQLAFKITLPNDQIALNALLICESAGVKEAGAAMIGALKRPPLRRDAARASNSFPELGAVSELMLACADSDKMTVVYALNALTKLSDPQSAATGQALIGSKDALIRKAAIRLVARFPETGIGFARLQVGAADEQVARAGVEILGLISTQESLKLAGEALRDGRSGLRIQAILALNGRCPFELRETFLSLRSDPDPRVRWVANHSDPGR